MPALDPAAFQAAITGGAVPLDLRAPAAFAAAHVPGAVFLQFGKQDLADRAELFLSKDDDYVLVMEPPPLGPIAEKLLTQGGFRVAGHLAGGMRAWQAAGLGTDSLPTADVAELQARIAAGSPPAILDVREDYEYAWGRIAGAVHLPHGEIGARAAELDPAADWHVVCNDQVRSGAATSLLQRRGFARVTLVLGGMAAWSEAGYPQVKAG